MADGALKAMGRHGRGASGPPHDGVALKPAAIPSSMARTGDGERMKCVVSSFGSAGDFLPTLAVAAALRRRGHAVRFVANPFYERPATNAGLDLVPAGERLDLYERIETTPAYAEPSNAKMLLADLVAPNIEATYRVVGDLLRAEPADAVVANDASFGALWAAAEQAVPSVLVHASPVLWMSWRAPAVLGDRALPGVLSRPVTAAARASLAWYMTRFLRRLGDRLRTRLPDVSFRASERMAAIRIGLWSPLLRGPVSSDPPTGRICGFARGSALGSAQPGLAPEVESFLATGPPPVVVGLGSAFALTARGILTSIAEACADGGHRCLVVGHPSGVEFPRNTLAVRYAPYDLVFPRAAAVVVHGGAGTTGEALRSGRPVIGVPFAFDQFALCAEIEKLGVGVRQPVARRTRSDFARALDRVLSDETMRRRARRVARRFAAERDGAESGADAVETLAERYPRGGGG
jgi:rhamnosyltransferase subunit B